ncbi:uncharacterized protein LOC116112813 [Pistacia vera]|uniref:uncharacterized protein LOC116112813 n=1 Tax=Pistacia vera TaxID=55513 RepID=UPI001263E214|nr:uncharacterized protein LOC116112813 [Pistacia vera]
MDSSLKLSKDHGDPLPGSYPYWSIAGRPNLSFAIQQLSQFLDKPTSSHLQAGHRVLRYIKGYPASSLYFLVDSSLLLKAFNDFDWASCVDTRRSITNFCIFLGCSLISWQAKKQTTVSRSSFEVKYSALASTTCELQWLNYLLHDLHMPHPHPALLFCDNMSALQIVANPNFHE